MLLQQETKFVHFIKPTQYYCLLGCDAVYLVEKYQDFWGEPPPPPHSISSCSDIGIGNQNADLHIVQISV
jgi:hypothetical protein